MSADPSIDESIAATAALWLARHDRGLRPEEQVEFDVWLASETRHAVAYDRVCAGWDQCENARKNPELVRLAQALDEQTRPRAVRAAWPWRPALGLAAAAGLVVCFGVWQRRVPVSPPAQEVAANFRVIPTTVQRLVLEDGSVAELRGSDSAIETVFTERERRVVLRRGEAFFVVAKNPDRPFVVAAGRIAVRAVGTAFNVQLKAAELAVVVTEGWVALVDEPEAKPAVASDPVSLASSLAVGQRALLSRGTATSAPVLLKVDALSSNELEDVLAWQATWLVFDETPIADVIEAFNRHGSRHFAVGDEALRLRKLTGTFRADNIEALLRLYELKVERRGDFEFLLASER